MIENNRYSHYMLVAMLVAWASCTQATTTISGKPDTSGEPFPFPILPHAYDPDRHVFYVGAKDDISGLSNEDKAQAVGAIGSGNTAVLAITPEKIKVNGVEDQDNPLFGQKINFLAMGDRELLVVTDGKKNVLNMILNARSGIRSVLESDPFTDASGTDISDGIVGIAGFGRRDDDGRPTERLFYVAVQPNGGVFGLPGSAVTQGKIVRNTTGEGEAAVTKLILHPQVIYPVNITTNGLKITTDLAAIDPVAVSMHASRRLDTAYTGLQVTGGAGATDGARSVLVRGHNAVAPNAAIQADSIIGGIGADIKVAAHYVATMWTSTSLDYLIVVGGVNPDPSTTKRDVYALPVVKASGQLAAKNALPETEAVKGENFLFKDRYFVTPATMPGDLFSPTDSDIYKARVGGNGTLPGDIADLFIEKDTVFVAVGAPDADQKGGVFYSQAIFDQLGRIMGWTDWRRTAGSTENIFGIALDNKLGRFFFMPGADSNSITTLKRNDWGTGNGFDRDFQAFFEDLSSGMQGLVDFDQTNSAFSQNVGDRISVLCATGFDKVVLVESGVDIGNTFSPTAGLTNSFVSTDGSLAGFVAGVDSIALSGGVLKDIGPIIAVDIVSDDTNSWLVVGGSHGLAVLANDDGTGWPVGTLEKGFANLPATARFKKIGGYMQVRRIIADNGKLYVLTGTSMIRIDASSALFSGGIGNVGVELASVAKLLDRFADTPDPLRYINSFSDIAVSGKLALLATNAGLLRVGNGKDIALATQQADINWTQVNLPESPGSVSRLFVVSPTGNQNEFATGDPNGFTIPGLATVTDNRGGNIYVLSATVSDSHAKVYRFAVTSLADNGSITDATVQLLNDVFVKDKNTFYLSHSDYRNYFVTDGALFFMSRSAYYPTKNKPFLEIIGANQRVGMRGAALKSSVVYKIQDGFRIGEIIHRSASGSWLVPGSQLGVGA